jgi:hypothetical protein
LFQFQTLRRYLPTCFEEAGHEVVAQYIEDACIFTVNLSEVAGLLIRDGVDPTPLLQQLERTAMPRLMLSAEPNLGRRG